MYSKSNILLFIAYMICTGLLIFSKRYDVQAESAARQAQTTVTVVTGNVELEQLESVERVISYETMKQRFCIDVSEKDLDTLMRIVEAEAGGEDRKGKLLVANVVINRVKSKRFPNNVTDVVYQKAKNVAQFSPVSNGFINQVKVSEETKEVVYSALKGEDVSNGALFFMARRLVAPENAAWFDSNLKFVFTYGRHVFYAR